jgi:HAD superfamily hydrolase (TIGR01509 family)
VTDYPRLVEIFTTTRCVLLDFDGPVCDVYAGRPASAVAEELRQEVASQIHEPLPDDVVTTDDPLHIIRRVADIAPHLSQRIETALQRAEIEAVTTATLTPGAAELLAVCHAAGHPVAIVSNNSAPAIRAFLTLHDLAHLVHHVQGRDDTDPHLMKPDPFLITEAINALDGIPEAAALIGDSTTDIDAARAAGIRVIGYINKPAKHQTLSHADAVTTDMGELARAAVEGGFTAPETSRSA